jgi:BlaI family penicillinase repressor
MTMLNILERKGHLTKDKKERAFVYRPAESKSQVISSMVNDFLQKVFDGSARPLLLSMVKEKKISREDLREIEKLMEDVE